MNIVKVHSIIDNSRSYEYVDDGEPKQGGVKDVYFSPDFVNLWITIKKNELRELLLYI